jgi:hypothetical protein
VIQIYTDGALVYDSREESHDLDGLVVTTGLNVGGTAQITMPAGHPAYSRFVAYKTKVAIYRDGFLRFRGRALYNDDDFHGKRTIICEGELCFFRDSIQGPYVFQDSPANIFTRLVRDYNKWMQPEPDKCFAVGEVTVTDANDYIRLESESAEDTLAILNKLVERCGGHITFSGPENARKVNWYATLDQQSNQEIEFGENLLDLTHTGSASATLATGLIPYGAKDEKTGERLTIASVNGGVSYIIAQEAKAVRGLIMATATWDEVTDPNTLLKKAKAHLDGLKSFITTLQLTALDLSAIDKSIDSFAVGDMIRVKSKPHGIDEYFQLSQMTEDLLNPANNTITLGKEIKTLTHEGAASDYSNKSEIATVKSQHNQGIQQVATSVEASVLQQASALYTPKTETAALAGQVQAASEAAGSASSAASSALTQIQNEVNARAGVINKVNGVVNISGGAPVKILGGKIEVLGSEVHIGDATHPTHLYGSGVKTHGTFYFSGVNAIFDNGNGVRTKSSDGSEFYVLRVDSTDSCMVGSDLVNLYLRGKDAVYLYKTGAVVTSDRRQKNAVEALPEAYVEALDKLTPVRFKYNGRGDQYHVGFVAQDVERALAEAGLTRADFGGFVDVSGDGSELGLAYDEFIGLLLEKMRRLEKRIAELEAKA